MTFEKMGFSKIYYKYVKVRYKEEKYMKNLKQMEELLYG